MLTQHSALDSGPAGWIADEDTQTSSRSLLLPSHWVRFGWETSVSVVLNVSFFSLCVKKQSDTAGPQVAQGSFPLPHLVPGTVVTLDAEGLKAASSLTFVCVLNSGWYHHF